MVTKVKTATVCVVGAGYVGLPLSKVFARGYEVISFDTDEEKVRNLSEQNGNPNHTFSTDPSLIAKADFILICVPTLLSKSKSRPRRKRKNHFLHRPRARRRNHTRSRRPCSRRRKNHFANKLES